MHPTLSGIRRQIATGGVGRGPCNDPRLKKIYILISKASHQKCFFSVVANAEVDVPRCHKLCYSVLVTRTKPEHWADTNCQKMSEGVYQLDLCDDSCWHC